MVILAPTALTASGSGTDALSYVTSQVSPEADSLLVLFVDSGTPVAGENDIPTITDSLGFTWMLRDTATDVVGATGPFLRGSFFTAEVPTGGDSGAITISFAHVQSSCHWHLTQIRGARNDDPVVQAGHALFSTTVNPSFDLGSGTELPHSRLGRVTLSCPLWWATLGRRLVRIFHTTWRQRPKPSALPLPRPPRRPSWVSRSPWAEKFRRL